MVRMIITGPAITKRRANLMAKKFLGYKFSSHHWLAPDRLVILDPVSNPEGA